MIQPWKKQRSRRMGDFRIFSVRSETKVSPHTGAEHDFFVIDSVNWVNVLPVTPDQELVMIDQYRHGSDTVELEIPGGMVDGGESPEATAVRELREETGYEGENARVLATLRPNPAIMSNSCCIVLIENCRLKHTVQWDACEDLITRLVPVPDIPRLVREGKIQHAIVLAALYQFQLWRHPQP